MGTACPVCWRYRVQLVAGTHKILACIGTVQVRLGGCCPLKNRGNDQLIGSVFPDAIVRTWMWSTATWSCPLGYFDSIAASGW